MPVRLGATRPPLGLDQISLDLEVVEPDIAPSPDISKIKDIVITKMQYVFSMGLLRGTQYATTHLSLGGVCTPKSSDLILL